jgi:hypothetical protein
MHQPDNNADPAHTTAQDNITPLQPPTKAAKTQISAEERAILDEAEELAKDAILEDTDGDDPGAKDEVAQIIVVKNLPKFVSFRVNPVHFELFGTVLQQGMDEVCYPTTKSFAPNFEEDVELKRYCFYETVTRDGVIRLVWAPKPGKDEKNLWIKTKVEAMEHAKQQWTAMRSRTSLGQWTYRPSRKQEGEPKFSGRTSTQWTLELKKAGLLVTDKQHAFYKKATDNE